MIGTTELLLVLAIVLIFFGVGKLPNVLGQMGKGVKAFKDGMKDPEEKAIDVTPDRDRDRETLRSPADAEEIRR